jgi:diphthamide biosynthesis protein 4
VRVSGSEISVFAVAPSMSGAGESSQPTHYQILGLPHTNETFDPTELRFAYRRALLIHHPDKSPAVPSSDRRSDGKGSNHGYSVDQITEAYNLLSSAAKKLEYDKSLEAISRRVNAAQRKGFHAGVETFDLDELPYDESAGAWSRHCRCGNDIGYRVTETDLETEAEHGEIFVGCKGCSLFIRVLFGTAAIDGDAQQNPGNAG